MTIHTPHIIVKTTQGNGTLRIIIDMDNQDSTSFASILAGVQRLRENGEVAREPENKQVQRQQQSPQPVQRQPSPHIGQKRINAFNQDKSRSQGPKVPKPSSLNVNSRQKQNPLMSSLTNVNYIFVEQRNVYDFLVNGRDVIFLSLKYHKLHPEYIQNRMKPLMKKNAILLCVVDVENSDSLLREINKLCLYSDFTLLLAFTYEQAAKYLTYLATSTKSAMKT